MVDSPMTVSDFELSCVPLVSCGAVLGDEMPDEGVDVSDTGVDGEPTGLKVEVGDVEPIGDVIAIPVGAVDCSDEACDGDSFELATSEVACDGPPEGNDGLSTKLLRTEGDCCLNPRRRASSGTRCDFRCGRCNLLAC